MGMGLGLLQETCRCRGGIRFMEPPIGASLPQYGSPTPNPSHSWTPLNCFIILKNDVGVATKNHFAPLFFILNSIVYIRILLKKLRSRNDKKSLRLPTNFGRKKRFFLNQLGMCLFKRHNNQENNFV